MRFVLLLVAVIPLAAQTFTFGTPSDPCTGGYPMQIAGTSYTVRWSDQDFSCTIPVLVPGRYSIDLQFLEPCYAEGACAQGKAWMGSRLLSVYAGQQRDPVVYQLDPFAAGASNVKPAIRGVLLWATGPIVLRVHTEKRAAVLSAVVLSPYPSAPVIIQSGVLRVSLQPGANGYVDVAADDPDQLEPQPQINLRLGTAGYSIDDCWQHPEWKPTPAQSPVCAGGWAISLGQDPPAGATSFHVIAGRVVP